MFEWFKNIIVEISCEWWRSWRSCNCEYNQPCKKHPEVYSGPDGEDGPWAPGWKERNKGK